MLEDDDEEDGSYKDEIGNEERPKRSKSGKRKDRSKKDRKKDKKKKDKKDKESRRLRKRANTGEGVTIDAIFEDDDEVVG